jgi:hypothetical protein
MTYFSNHKDILGVVSHFNGIATVPGLQRYAVPVCHSDFERLPNLWQLSLDLISKAADDFCRQRWCITLMLFPKVESNFR